jgi:hypothetical protein
MFMHWRYTNRALCNAMSVLALGVTWCGGRCRLCARWNCLPQGHDATDILCITTSNDCKMEEASGLDVIFCIVLTVTWGDISKWCKVGLQSSTNSEKVELASWLLYLPVVRSLISVASWIWRLKWCPCCGVSSGCCVIGALLIERNSEMVWRLLLLLLRSVGSAQSRLTYCSLSRLIVLTPVLVPQFISRVAPRQTAWETSVSKRRNYGR